MLNQPRWAIVISKPNQERRAFDNLSNNGFESFLPFVKYQRRVEPLFPRYLFSVVGNAWHRVLSTTGVASVLRLGMQPATLSSDVIKELRERCGNDGVFVPVSKRWQKGMKARIERGVFAGHLVVIDKMVGNDRVSVLLSIFGASALVCVDENNLIAA